MKNDLHEEKKHFFCKDVLLYAIITISMVLETIISKFSCILKMISRNNFPDPQPDSPSYPVLFKMTIIYKHFTLTSKEYYKIPDFP